MNALRRDALAVLRAGLRAIKTRDAVRQACRLHGEILTVGKKRFDLARYRRIFVIGMGKASLESAKELEDLLGDRITDGIVLDVKRSKLRRIKSVAGTHPLPSVANMRATGEIMAILKQVDSRDLVITIVSGGGSALLCWPFELKCDDLSLVFKALMAKGATIAETNIVRKHLSEILGGQFARLAYPATVLGLIFSDVPGNDIGVIASGPTVLDSSTIADAERIIVKYDLLRSCKIGGCNLRETPKDPSLFKRVTNVLVVSNAIAIDAMVREAKSRGYTTRVLSTELTGEARDVGRRLAAEAKPGEMVLAGGETTVTVRGKGKGGRNQELALGALRCVLNDVLVLSCASDGIDNSPAAGAIADKETVAHANRHRLNPEFYLERNDSFSFFKRTGDQIITGITGANVSDLMLSARAKPVSHR
jgi:glycerate-2-kinase